MASYTTFDFKRLSASTDLDKLCEAIRRAKHEVTEEGARVLSAIGDAAGRLRSEWCDIEDSAGYEAFEETVSSLISLAAGVTHHFRELHERRAVLERDRELDDRSERFREGMAA